MDSFLLKFLDLFKGLFNFIKVDYVQLRAIVAMKLLTDNRRQIVAYRRKETKEPTNAFLWTMFLYMILGFFIASALLQVPSFLISMIIFFSYLMVMIIMTLITDFSSVLLDTSDNTIILPRPVDGRTLFISRITHIFLYLGQLTFSLALVPCAVILFKYGILFLFSFGIAIILTVITALFITNAFYLTLMQFASEEKLKNVINYFQIVMAVLVMGAYQLMPRMADYMGTEDQYFEIGWWSYLAPPIWMAGALEALYFHFWDVSHLVFIVLSILVPIGGFYLVNRFLTPLFLQKLNSINTSSSKSETTKTSTEKNDNLLHTLSSWITREGIERSAFQLVYKILGRDRKIKLKIYPSFGYLIILGLIFIFRSKEDLATTLADLPNTQYHLFLLYISFLVLQVAIHELPYSDDFKASWIYFSAPINRPGEILSGTLKAAFIRLFVPAYIVVCVVVVFVWRQQALDDVLFGFLNNILMILILVLLSNKHLPLSMASSLRGQSGNLLRGALTFLIIGILGLVHYLLAQQPFFILMAMPVQVLIIYFLHKLYQGTAWKSIVY